MSKPMPKDEAGWTLADWECALTIRVGAAFVCRQCQNVVMVTKGGVGVMELNCCGKPMQKAGAREGGQ